MTDCGDVAFFSTLNWTTRRRQVIGMGQQMRKPAALHSSLPSQPERFRVHSLVISGYANEQMTWDESPGAAVT